MDRNNLNYLVYVHTNKINGKKYVGQSSNIVERWRNGGKNYFSSIKFFRAIQKYGWENFTHEILYENLNKEAANKIERDLIRKYDSINNGYNIQEGGYTSLTQNSLDKMSKSLKQGYLDHPERRQKISEKLIGRKNSEETKTEIVEKQRQEQENKALREEINSLKEMFKEFINTSLKQEKHGNNN